jgi:uncharacterized membrane-anchored protein YhcB (DUF1043 family)
VEYANSVWQISIIALVAGVMIGALAYRLLSSSDDQIDKIKFELDSTKLVLDEYKISVNQHFNKTSELVNDLTEDYVKVYKHLAEGAQSLGDSKALNSLLEQHQGRVSIAIANETSVPEEIPSHAIDEPEEVLDTPAEAIDEHAEPFVGKNEGDADSSSLKTDADADISSDSESKAVSSDPIESTKDAGKADEESNAPTSKIETETPKVKPEF